ncbi:hypothetical protein Taro_019174, partial [Colocasia esculenta]|nr:hypothetical protein [Colocasia esculenta]
GELDGEICAVRFFRATLRLDDWRMGDPQLVSRDAECDSVLCVLLVVVLSRLPWSPFSTCLCAFEPARFQFSQCAPEGVAYYATGSCVLTECGSMGNLRVSLAGQDSGYWSGTGNVDLGSLQLVSEPGDVVFGRWLCRHLSRRLEMPRHHSRLALNLRTYLSELLCAVAFWHLEEVALRLFPSVSVAPVGLYVSPWLGWIVLFPVPDVFLPDGGLFCAWVPVCGGTGMCGFPTSWCVWDPEGFVLSALDLVEPVAESPVVRLVTVRSIGLLVPGHVLLTFCMAPRALVSLLDHEDGLCWLSTVVRSMRCRFGRLGNKAVRLVSVVQQRYSGGVLT